MTTYASTMSVARRAGAISDNSAGVGDTAGVIAVETWTCDRPLVSSVCSELVSIAGPDTGLPYTEPCRLSAFT